MMLLWREAWIKPLSEYDLGSEKCAYCKERFNDLDFVTSCEFCELGIMHDLCANNHINTHHGNQVNAKVAAHKDKPLHDYQ
ncbi:MAG: hypothetical protein WCF23_07550 [Candidatus Nitrosopolaris sp.]